MKNLKSLLLLLIVVVMCFGGCSNSDASIGNIANADLSKEYSTGKSNISIVSVQTTFSISPALSDEKYSCENEDKTLLAIELDITDLNKGVILSEDLISATATNRKLKEFESLTYIETEDYTKLETNVQLQKGNDYIAHIVFEIPTKDDEYRVSIKTGSKTDLIFNYVYEDKACVKDVEVVSNRYKKIGDYESAYKLMKKNSEMFSNNDIYYCKGLTYEKYGDLGNALDCFKLCNENDPDVQSKESSILQTVSQYDGEYKYQYRSHRYSYIYIKNGFACVSDSEIDKENCKFNYSLIQKDGRFYLTKKSGKPKEITDKNMEFQLVLNTDTIGNKLRVIVVGSQSKLMYNGSFEEIK